MENIEMRTINPDTKQVLMDEKKFRHSDAYVLYP